MNRFELCCFSAGEIDNDIDSTYMSNTWDVLTFYHFEYTRLNMLHMNQLNMKQCTYTIPHWIYIYIFGRKQLLTNPRKARCFFSGIQTCKSRIRNGIQILFCWVAEDSYGWVSVKPINNSAKYFGTRHTVLGHVRMQCVAVQKRNDLWLLYGWPVQQHRTPWARRSNGIGHQIIASYWFSADAPAQIYPTTTKWLDTSEQLMHAQPHQHECQKERASQHQRKRYKAGVIVWWITYRRRATVEKNTHTQSLPSRCDAMAASGWARACGNCP